LVAGLTITIAAVIVFLLVRRIRNYNLVMSGHLFLNPSGNIDHSRLNELAAYDEANLEKRIIVSYIQAISHNDELNSKKSKIITVGEIMFVAGVIFLLVSLGIQLLGIATGEISV
jgi:hypothetical protein